MILQMLREWTQIEESILINSEYEKVINNGE